jgi:hypothetical protein
MISEMIINIYQITRCHISDDGNLHFNESHFICCSFCFITIHSDHELEPVFKTISLLPEYFTARLAMMYNTQNYRVFAPRPSTGKVQETTNSGYITIVWDCFIPMRELQHDSAEIQ